VNKDPALTTYLTFTIRPPNFSTPAIKNEQKDYHTTRTNLPPFRTESPEDSVKRHDTKMQPLVNAHGTCPKCSASIDGDGKTCGSCGATCPN